MGFGRKDSIAQKAQPAAVAEQPAIAQEAANVAEEVIPASTAKNAGFGRQGMQDALVDVYDNEADAWDGGGSAHVDKNTHEVVYQNVMTQINPEDISNLSRDDLRETISALVGNIITVQGLPISQVGQDALTDELVKDMLGFGPLDDLLEDDAINDILINGPNRIYVERRGKMELTNVRFRDVEHLYNISQRIAVLVGRHVDETNPLSDARLPDGSRVHIALPPIASDGPYLSIRKFSKHAIDTDAMIRNGSMSHSMGQLLDVASICRLNLLVAGGTGAGKTTVLNVLSQKIEPTQRILTVEDTLELQLQQPHVVRLECRAANSEGIGGVDIRELVRNALRMRPDRIVVGEVRGGEIFDMLQAMNTGHDGSMATVHANNPRDTLARVENMMAQTGMNLPVAVVRQYITSALDLIIYVERMRDGVRRISSITEVVGMEGDSMVSQPLFEYKFQGEDSEGMLDGQFESAGLKPRFFERARYFGVEKELINAMGIV